MSQNNPTHRALTKEKAVKRLTFRIPSSYRTIASLATKVQGSNSLAVSILGPGTVSASATATIRENNFVAGLEVLNRAADVLDYFL